MFRRTAIAFLLVILGSGMPGEVLAARGSWYDPYLDALEALDSGDAASALPLLEQALARTTESGSFRTYGTNYLRYAPHMQVARARHALGDCDAARAALERAAAAGEIEADASFGPLAQSIRAACAPKVGAPSPERAEAQESAPLAAPLPTMPSVDVAAFERGLMAYLAGDLASAVGLLERVAADAPRSAAAQLVLGTVLHASWTAGGKDDAATHARARAALTRARELDPFLAPPPGICPPEVRELHAKSR